MMILILVLVALFSAYGIVQSKKQGNVFGLVFSLVSTVVFGFSTVLALIL